MTLSVSTLYSRKNQKSETFFALCSPAATHFFVDVGLGDSAFFHGAAGRDDFAAPELALGRHGACASVDEY